MTAAALIGLPVERVMTTRDPAEALLFKLVIQRGREMRAEERKDLARRIINQLAEKLKFRRSKSK